MSETADIPIEEQIIQMATLNYEPLPMLEVIFEKLCLSVSSSLKTFTSSIADVTLNSFRYVSYAEAMGALPRHGLLAVVHAHPWDNALTLSMDADFLYAALELMLGGKPAPEKLVSKRDFTSIERRVGQRLAELMLEDLSEGMRQISEAWFNVERMESNPQFVSLSQPSSPCVHVLLDVAFEECRGKVSFVIPYDTIDPIRPLLTKVFYGEKLGGDALWRRHLTAGIESSTVTLTALLHERPFPMAEVLGWRVGDTIDLRLEADHEATVLCSGVEMFRGVTGKRQNGSTALRITQELKGKEALRDDGTMD
ncbi:flagellar motor switch protein FliM [Acidimangrovimonas pyrenivorans]|uniref:Flagellar motor switch protein FliM n=1 Tax=Acidimangrovimonas pyrenivorans TaxID=2030798 RepID=A0ABV7ANY7_9RHOB